MVGFIDEIRSAFARVATAQGIPPAVAQQVTADAFAWAQREHGGQRVYIYALNSREALRAEIRREYELRRWEKGIQAKLARKYGVSQSMVSRTINRVSNR